MPFKKLFLLLFIPFLLFSASGTGISGTAGSSWTTSCPTLDFSSFPHECKAFCPEGMTPVSQPDTSGSYVCVAKGTFFTHKCYYYNPFCEVKVNIPIGSFETLLGHHTFTELMLRTATLDSSLFEESFSESLSVGNTNFGFFVKAFNQLAPVFENFAFFLFSLTLLLSLAYLGIVKGVQKYFNKGYPYSETLPSKITKIFFVIALFGLPINQPVSGDLPYQPASLPFAVSVLKYTVLTTDSIASQLSKKLSEFYIESSYGETLQGLQTLRTQLQTQKEELLTKIATLQSELMNECINPAKNCGVENPEFDLPDNDLDDVNFCDASGNPLPNRLERAVMCRDLEKKVKSLTALIQYLDKISEQAKETYEDLSKDKKKYVAEIKEKIDNINNHLGFLGSGVSIPLVYLKVATSITKKIQEDFKDILPASQTQDIEEKYQEKTGGWIAKALGAMVLVSIPPFSDMFQIVKNIIKENVGLIATAIASWGIASSVFSGGISVFLGAFLISLLIVAKNVASTVLAIVIVSYIAYTLLPILVLLAIATAVIFRFIQFIKDLVVYVFVLPFKVQFIYFDRSLEALQEFVKNLMKFAIIILLITISPLFGLFVYALTKFLLLGYFAFVFETLRVFPNIGLIAKIFIYMISATIYVLANLLTIYYAFKYTYQAPDLMFEYLKIPISQTVHLYGSFAERMVGKIAPKI